MKKIFVTDLDGTLLSPGNIISEKTRSSIEKLKNDGFQIIFASGRVLSSLKYLMSDIGLTGLYIANNGGILASDQEIISTHPIDVNSLKLISDLCDLYGITYHFYNQDTFFANELIESRVRHLRGKNGANNQAKFEIRRNVLEYIIENNIDIYKMMLHKDPYVYPDFMKEFEKINNISYAASAPDSLDIFSKNTNKWAAVEDYIELCKEDTYVVAIGDYDNDIEMLSNADFGIAMGNASEKVKSFAKYVTDENKNDGFSKAIDYVIEELKC